MGLVNNLRPDKRSLFDNLFTTSELILQLKDQGNLCSRYLTSRGCEIPTEKEMRKSSYRAINQFTEKSGLVFYVWFDYCQVITISNSLVRVLFLMQSDMLLRQKKRSYWFHALPLLKFTIGLWAYRQSRYVTQLSNTTEWSKMVPSYCFLLEFTYPCKCFHPLSPGWW